MLNAIMLNAILLNAILLNAIMLNAIMLNAIMLNAIMLNTIMLNAILLNAIMLNGAQSTNFVQNRPKVQIKKVLQSRPKKVRLDVDDRHFFATRKKRVTAVTSATFSDGKWGKERWTDERPKQTKVGLVLRLV